jgi:hypothetical protein
MAASPLEEYLATQDPSVHPVVTALHEAVVAAAPDLQVAVKYKMLMYSVEGRWRTWTCAVGTTSKVVALRFLYGVILDDPLGVLRAGSSVLMTWDFPLHDPSAVDARAVGGYVRDAVAKYPDYLADADGIAARAREEHGRGRGR